MFDGWSVSSSNNNNANPNQNSGGGAAGGSVHSNNNNSSGNGNAFGVDWGVNNNNFLFGGAAGPNNAAAQQQQHNNATGAATSVSSLLASLGGEPLLSERNPSTYSNASVDSAALLQAPAPSAASSTLFGGSGTSPMSVGIGGGSTPNTLGNQHHHHHHQQQQQPSPLGALGGVGGAVGGGAVFPTAPIAAGGVGGGGGGGSRMHSTSSFGNNTGGSGSTPVTPIGVAPPVEEYPPRRSQHQHQHQQPLQQQPTAIVAPSLRTGAGAGAGGKPLAQLSTVELVAILSARNCNNNILRVLSQCGYNGLDFIQSSFLSEAFDSRVMTDNKIKQMSLAALEQMREDLMAEDAVAHPAGKRGAGVGGRHSQQMRQQLQQSSSPILSSPSLMAPAAAAGSGASSSSSFNNHNRSSAMMSGSLHQSNSDLLLVDDGVDGSYSQGGGSSLLAVGQQQQQQQQQQQGTYSRSSKPLFSNDDDDDFIPIPASKTQQQQQQQQAVTAASAAANQKSEKKNSKEDKKKEKKKIQQQQQQQQQTEESTTVAVAYHQDPQPAAPAPLTKKEKLKQKQLEREQEKEAKAAAAVATAQAEKERIQKEKAAAEEEEQRKKKASTEKKTAAAILAQPPPAAKEKTSGTKESAVSAMLGINSKPAVVVAQPPSAKEQQDKKKKADAAEPELVPIGDEMVPVTELIWAEELLDLHRRMKSVKLVWCRFGSKCRKGPDCSFAHRRDKSEEERAAEKKQEQRDRAAAAVAAAASAPSLDTVAVSGAKKASGSTKEHAVVAAASAAAASPPVEDKNTLYCNSCAQRRPLTSFTRSQLKKQDDSSRWCIECLTAPDGPAGAGAGAASSSSSANLSKIRSGGEDTDAAEKQQQQPAKKTKAQLRQEQKAAQELAAKQEKAHKDFLPAIAEKKEKLESAEIAKRQHLVHDEGGDRGSLRERLQHGCQLVVEQLAAAREFAHKAERGGLEQEEEKRRQAISTANDAARRGDLQQELRRSELAAVKKQLAREKEQARARQQLEDERDLAAADESRRAAAAAAQQEQHEKLRKKILGEETCAREVVAAERNRFVKEARAEMKLPPGAQAQQRSAEAEAALARAAKARTDLEHAERRGRERLLDEFFDAQHAVDRELQAFVSFVSLLLLQRSRFQDDEESVRGASCRSALSQLKALYDQHDEELEALYEALDKLVNDFKMLPGVEARQRVALQKEWASAFMVLKETPVRSTLLSAFANVEGLPSVGWRHNTIKQLKDWRGILRSKVTSGGASPALVANRFSVAGALAPFSAEAMGLNSSNKKTSDGAAAAAASESGSVSLFPAPAATPDAKAPSIYKVTGIQLAGIGGTLNMLPLTSLVNLKTLDLEHCLDGEMLLNRPGCLPPNLVTFRLCMTHDSVNDHDDDDVEDGLAPLTGTIAPAHLPRTLETFFLTSSSFAGSFTSNDWAAWPPRLTKLTLARNNFCGIVDLVALLNACPGMESLSLAGNDFSGVVRIETLKDSKARRQHWPNLKSVYLFQNQFQNQYEADQMCEEVFGCSQPKCACCQAKAMLQGMPPNMLHSLAASLGVVPPF